MRKTLAIFLVSLAAFGQQPNAPFLWAKPQTTTVNYLVKQDFEGTGYDNGETWTENGTGTINEDYTTAPLNGSQSLNIITSSQSGRTGVNFPAQDEIWIYFRLNPLQFDTSGSVLFWLDYDRQDENCSVPITGHPFTFCSSACASTAVGMNNTNVVYDVWAHWKKGTGANEIHEIAFATNSTYPPTNWSTYAINTSGNKTHQITNLTFGVGFANTTKNHIIDKVRVSTSVIGDNPP